MSTSEQQAMGVERLTFEVEQAERHGFLSIQPVSVTEVRGVLDALAAAKARAEEAERKLADQIVDIRKHAPDYLNKRVEQYRTRVHAGLDRLEDGIEALERGSARTALNSMKAAVHVLEGNS